MTTHVRTKTPLLKVDGLSLTLGGRLILRDVNFEVDDTEGVGEVICVLGPSGIGKSQLSMCIAGLRTPTRGRVLLKDDHPTGPGMVCMVPQFYPMFDYTTVEGNLYIAGRQAGLAKVAIGARAAQYVDTFGLREHLGKYPGELSGGTKQRVAIARQLMCSSNYLIMDEPFSGLDPVMKKAAMGAIVKLASLDSYSVTFVVTHDVTEGMSIADRVILMGRESKVPGTNPHPESGGPGFLDGATIVETLDLAAEGYAWRPDIQKDPRFLEYVGYVKDKFGSLN